MERIYALIYVTFLNRENKKKISLNMHITNDGNLHKATTYIYGTYSGHSHLKLRKLHSFSSIPLQHGGKQDMSLLYILSFEK
jgi:hypothetical protein